VNSLEDRLRDAYRAAAGTVSPDRLRMPPRWPDPGPRRLVTWGARLALGPWTRLAPLAPLAAAAAVVAVVIGSVVAIGAWPRIMGPTTQTGQSPAPTPRFMLVVPGGRAADADPLYPPAQIQVASTGHVTGTLSAPRVGTHWVAAAASADNRSFVLAAEPDSASEGDYTLLYRLTLTSGGQPASLMPLDVPRISATILLAGGLAESADGQRVAYLSVRIPLTAHPTATIGVIDTATGQVRKWTISQFAGPRSVSLSADGSLLAVSVQAGRFQAVWVVPTDAAPGPVEQRGRPAVRLSPPGESGKVLNSSVISADGATLFVLTFHTINFHVTTTLAAYSVANGRLLRTVGALNAEDGSMSADPSVDRVVIWGSAPPVVIDLRTGTTQTLRVSLPAYVSTSAVAW
jgi:hypothetical protein